MLKQILFRTNLRRNSSYEHSSETDMLEIGDFWPGTNVPFMKRMFVCVRTFGVSVGKVLALALFLSMPAVSSLQILNKCLGNIVAK